MDFLEELSWRGMLNDKSDGVEKALQEGSIRGYIGFDPTAPSLTIGNYIQVMILHFFQKSGHQPIVLMGGATGRVGDPSGKDAERALKSYEELDKNLAHQKSQFESLLNFKEGDNKAIMVNNLDFYKNMNILDFLRDVGKTISINYMLAKDSVKNRLEKGLSFAEFSYQILQAYDFQCLYQQKNCILQMGGSDQWGNITSGTEFIRRNLGTKAHAITTPLLIKADGSKFGKSAEGNIWLDPNLTSPYKFYQFWINTSDDDIGKFLRYFSFQDREQVEAWETEHTDDARKLKLLLAKEMTARIHGQDKLAAVINTSELLFNKKANKEFLTSLQPSDWQMLALELPSFEVSKSRLSDGMNVVDFLAEATTIVQSKGEGRRAIKGNAISINKQKVIDFNATITEDDLIHNTYLMVENGKKHKYLVQVR